MFLRAHFRRQVLLRRAGAGSAGRDRGARDPVPALPTLAHEQMRERALLGNRPGREEGPPGEERRVRRPAVALLALRGPLPERVARGEFRWLRRARLEKLVEPLVLGLGFEREEGVAILNGLRTSS